MFRNKKDKNQIQNIAADVEIRENSIRSIITLVMLIYCTSGACSLIYEVIWVRLLKLTIGNTVYASTTVVSVFMAGLALGAFVMGRFSDRIGNRLKVYALLEILITISAVLSPLALRTADEIYVWFYRLYNPSNLQLLAVQIPISACIVFIPSFLMGSTLPLLGRLVTSIETEAGHLVGKLYAINTLGAAFGCFMAGFVFIRFLGVMGTLYLAAILNVLVALGGWILSSRLTTNETKTAEEVIIPTGETTRFNRRFLILVAAFFTSGFISIGYELLWMRSIIHLLNSFTYVFSAVLTIYLLGNVIGAGIGSGLVKSLKRPALGFAVTLFLLGLYGIFYLPTLLLWSSKIMPGVDREVQLAANLISVSSFMIKPLIQCAFLFFIPTIIMGIGFPIALQAWAGHTHKVGRTTGAAYAANTIGAVAGGIFTGFVFLPLFGLQISITFLGLMGVWIAAVLSMLFIEKTNKTGRFALPALAVVLTIAAFAMPSNLFNTVVARNPTLPKPLDLLEVKEGVTTTVSLFRNPDEDTLYLFTSGQRVAGDTFFWRSDQKILGHFGVLLNSNAQKVLSIGFGSGESTACLALHNLERIDCAEIAPEIVDLSLRYFKHINLGEHLNEKVNMVYMDAKNYIHLTDIKYDAIVNDSIHPRMFAENASLYTKEYYQSAREHLAPGGLFLSWIPSHNVEPASVLKSIIGTQMDVFPYITIWYMTTSPALYYVVIGSEQPQYFSPKYIDDQLAKNGVGESLSLININNSRDLMTCYIGDKNDLMPVISNYAVNSDYTPFIEFTTDNRPAGDYAFKEFIRLVRGDSVYSHIDWTGYNAQQKQQWLSQFERLQEASTYLLLTNSTDDYMEKIQYCMDGLSILPDNPALLEVSQRTQWQMFSIGEKMVNLGSPEIALNISDRILKVNNRSAFALILKSAALQKMGDLQQARLDAQTAVELDVQNPEAFLRMGQILYANSEFDEAINQYNKAVGLGESYLYFTVVKKVQLNKELAKAYQSAGRKTEATDTIEKAIAMVKAAGRPELADDLILYLNSLKSSN
jgi:spermidine synthase